MPSTSKDKCTLFWKIFPRGNKKAIYINSDQPEYPPPAYHTAIAGMTNNGANIGGQYNPMDPSNIQQNSINFFAIYGYNGNVSLAKGTDPHEVYGTIEKMRLLQSGQHAYDPTKAYYSSQRHIGNSDADDEENHIPLPPPPPPPPEDPSCKFCKRQGGPDKVRMVSELKIEVCKECLREHWTADFDEFWVNNDPDASKRRKK